MPLAFWLGVWQFGAMAADFALGGRGNELLLPYPATVAVTLAALAGEGEFWLTVLLSLCRVLAGLGMGTALGLMLAGLTAFSSLADALLSPCIRVVRATPVASFIILVLLWTPRGWVPVVISALMVLPVVWGNAERGFRETDGQLLEMAKVYRFSRAKRLRLIYLPSVRPYFVSGVTTALGLAWKSGVAAEVLCLPAVSMGTQIYRTKLYLEVPSLFAWTAAVVVLSLVLEKALKLLLRRWRG